MFLIFLLESQKKYILLTSLTCKTFSTYNTALERTYVLDIHQSKL